MFSRSVSRRLASSRGVSRHLAIGGALAALVVAAPAWAEADANVKQALALHVQGKAEEAYRLLAPLAGARAGDVDYDYALGIAAVDSGHYGEAILALQRVLAVQPGNAQARSEIARAYAMSGDVDTAKAQFDTVLQDPSLPDPVRQRFTQLTRDYGKQISGGGSDITGFVDVSGGYDSNINSATDLTSITIPLFAVFGPGTLSGSARATDQGFGEIQAGVSGVSAVGRQDRLFASLLGNWHDNLKSEAFDQGSATLTAGYGHSFANRDTLSLSGQAQQFWLGRDSYRQAIGAIAQYTHLLKGGRALSLSGQVFRLNYDNQPLLDANRYALAVSYADKLFVASLSGGHEETVRQAGDAQSNSFADASIGLEAPLAPKLSVVAGAAFDLRRYDQTDVLFLTKRKDERIDASIGLKYLIANGLYVRPKVSYTRNFSNIALYDFDRWTASVGVRFEF